MYLSLVEFCLLFLFLDGIGGYVAHSCIVSLKFLVYLVRTEKVEAESKKEEC